MENLDLVFTSLLYGSVGFGFGLLCYILYNLHKREIVHLKKLNEELMAKINFTIKSLKNKSVSNAISLLHKIPDKYKKNGQLNHEFVDKCYKIHCILHENPVTRRSMSRRIRMYGIDQSILKKPELFGNNIKK